MVRPRLRRIACWLGAASLALMAFGYQATRGAANERPELQLAISAQARAVGDGGILDLARVASFDWDRVFLFCPYSTSTHFHAALGFPWSPCSYAEKWVFGDLGPLGYDSRWLLVFVSGEEEVTGWLVVNESFDEIEGLDHLRIEWTDEYFVFARDVARFRLQDVTSEHRLARTRAWKLLLDETLPGK